MCSGHSLAHRAPLRSEYVALCSSRRTTQFASPTLLALSANDGLGNIKLRECPPSGPSRPLLLGHCRDATGGS